MLDQKKLRLASGIGLIIAIAAVMVQSQSAFRDHTNSQLYFGCALVAVFAYLFLSSRSEEERDLPWWW